MTCGIGTQAYQEADEICWDPVHDSSVLFFNCISFKNNPVKGSLHFNSQSEACNRHPGMLVSVQDRVNGGIVVQGCASVSAHTKSRGPEGRAVVIPHFWNCSLVKSRSLG